jgi:HAD superfamily hydrolase (TIGR01509 family)
MLRAIIFDFNGVILNDEPLHFQSMLDTVAELGIRITEEEYYREYLPLDDSACLEAICRNHGAQMDNRERSRLLDLKSLNYRRLLRDQYPLFPGAADLVRAASRSYPLALASGARRDEILSTLQATDLLNCFKVIAGAEDFARGKPHPESYLFALERLNDAQNGSSHRILPAECLVIEDSVGGVKGARAAGMVCVAVAHTYPSESLRSASHVVSSIQELKLEELERLCREPS